MKNKKSKNQINPEILREREEKRKLRAMYDDEDDFEMSLFPGAFAASTISATESTGLIQVIPTPDMMDVYDDVFSYRRREPAANDEFTD